MSTGKRLSKPFLAFLLMSLLALALVACGGAEEGQGTLEAYPGGGLQETPLFEETPALEETPLVEETPLMEETPEMVEETPMMEETPLMEETAVMEETPVMEETAPVEETPTTDEGAQGEAPATIQWVLSDDLDDMPVVDQEQVKVGTVTEVLVDLQGNVDYVLVDTELDQTQTVALSWDQIEVHHRSEMMDDVDDVDDADDMDDMTDDDMSQAETPVAGQLMDDDDFVLVYSGVQADLAQETTVESDLLDDVGALLSLEDLGLGVEAATEGGDVLQLTESDDYDLVNLEDNDLGEIDELVIDTEKGAVLYAVADIGGFLGIGENSIAIPWTELQFDETDDEFVVDATEEMLTDAPIVDVDDWDDGMAPSADWNAEVDSFWQQSSQ